jgi:hypothetical protein
LINALRKSHSVEARRLGIKRAAQSSCGDAGEAQGQGTAASCGNRTGPSFAQNRRTERVRYHDATIFGDQRDRKPTGNGEVQAIGKFTISRPFLVSSEIGKRSLDFNDEQIAALAQSQSIGSPSVSEWEFEQT